MDKIEQLKEIIDQSQHLVFFGGAGVSTESGIPDFRSSDGLYSQKNKQKIPAEVIISHSFYKENPAEFFDYYFKHLVFDEAGPNLAHTFIADLEKTGKRVSVVTQNIDGLHQKAGSSEVYELHGSVYDNYCEQCGQNYSLSELNRDEDGIPRCDKDGAIVRPNVVLYEEQLDQNTLMGAVQAINQADTMIVAGTSLVVYPAAGLLQYFRGDHLVVINKSALSISSEEALVFQDRISRVFSELEDEIAY